MKSPFDGWEMTEEQERRCAEAIRRNETLAYWLVPHVNDTPRNYFTGAEFEERMRVERNSMSMGQLTFKGVPIVFDGPGSDEPNPRLCAWVPSYADGPGHKKDT